MKKILLYSLMMFAGLAHAFAQKDAQAKSILNEVSKKYRSYDVIKTDFTFALDNQQAGVKESQSGTLISQSKANKFKITFYSPGKHEVAQEIISDGKTQWTYLKKDNEVQVNEPDRSREGFNPAQIFTIYEHGYKYLYTGDEKLGGKLCQVIDLSPVDGGKSFFKIRLFIEKARHQIYSALIFDKNGNKYNYTMRTFTPNVKVPASTFSFDKKDHPGVEVVDLK